MNNEFLAKLDKVYLKVFQTANSSFLGSVLCQLDIELDESIGTAATDGKRLIISESFFNSLNEDEQVALILHEVWHVARLHMFRRESRDPHLWNIACDIVINNELSQDLKGSIRWNDLFLIKDSLRNLSEEEVYDFLLEKNLSNTFTSVLLGDIKDGTSLDETITVVSTAYQNACVNGCGNSLGNISNILDKFLSPIIPWNILLEQYLTALRPDDYSWRRPSRRYEEVYLPSIDNRENKLEHIAFFLDTSGSISEKEIERFFSEVKYVKDTLNPTKLTIAQFDTRIHSITTYKEDDQIYFFQVKGRGGTSLEEVYHYINDNKPDCSIILSDMYCSPMNKVKTPVLFVVFNNPEWTSPFGKVIHA